MIISCSTSHNYQLVSVFFTRVVFIFPVKALVGVLFVQNIYWYCTLKTIQHILSPCCVFINRYKAPEDACEQGQLSLCVRAFPFMCVGSLRVFDWTASKT